MRGCHFAATRLATTATGAAPTDATTSQYLYDGDQPILELTGLGAIRRRFVPGPGLDNVIVQIDHDGGGVPERRWMLSDDLGSVAAVTDRTGKATRFNAYGPFGGEAKARSSGPRRRRTWRATSGAWAMQAR